MIVKTLVLGPMGNCTYIIEQNGNAVLVDPSWDMEEIEMHLKGLHLSAIFFTHGHFDHVKDVAPFLRSYDIKAYIEQNDVQVSQLPLDILQPFTGDKNLQIDGFDIEVLSTPGHSEGSVCVKIGGNLFTGDTLFPGACGRVDLPHSNPRKMRQSLYRLSQLPPETKIYAGHGYGEDGGSTSIIGYEREHNIYMVNSIRDALRK
ncbi:glyoxylase-like metal-dependent hydrolase (beta-lactamase superfamily II) [Elusimicrobium simillimum]|uniref:MBL fold metallo-hydrolase n=1 Tax=Elusimicrobium simillimum TaxID=3143438 RepID=UPI003C6F0328